VPELLRKFLAKHKVSRRKTKKERSHSPTTKALYWIITPLRVLWFIRGERRF